MQCGLVTYRLFGVWLGHLPPAPYSLCSVDIRVQVVAIRAVCAGGRSRTPHSLLAATARKRGAEAKKERNVKKKILEVELDCEDLDLGNQHERAEPETQGR